MCTQNISFGVLKIISSFLWIYQITMHMVCHCAIQFCLINCSLLVVLVLWFGFFAHVVYACVTACPCVIDAQGDSSDRSDSFICAGDMSVLLKLLMWVVWHLYAVSVFLCTTFLGNIKHFTNLKKTCKCHKHVLILNFRYTNRWISNMWHSENHW